MKEWKFSVMKYIALIMILAGCSGYGFLYAMELEKKYRELIYFKQIIFDLAVTIEKGKLTFGECCLEVSKTCRAPYKSFLQTMCERLENGCCESIHTIWQEELQEMNRFLKWKELKILCESIHFGSTSFVEEPVETLKNMVTAIDMAIIQMDNVRKERKKPAICMGICIGGFLCLVLW